MFEQAETLGEFLIADKGYDSDEFRAQIEQRGSTPVIPGRKNRIDKIFKVKNSGTESSIVLRFSPLFVQYDREGRLFRENGRWHFIELDIGE